MSFQTTPAATTRRRPVITSMVMVMTVCALIASGMSASAAAERGTDLPDPWSNDGLTVLGEVPNPWQEDWWGEVTLVDAEARRGYGQMLGNRLAVYDLNTTIPTPLRISEAMVSSAGAWSPYTMTIDHARDRMLIVGRSPSTENRSLIDIIDLKTLAHTGTWDLATILPGYVAMGFTYDKATDRVLLVGDFTGTVNAGQALSSFGYKAVGPGSAVVALDAASGSVVWVAPMRQCHSVLNSVQVGAMIVRSIYRPSLYVFCGAGRAAQQPTGQSALVRLNIAGAKTANGVVEFPAESFPISGDYAGTPSATGVVGFDPRSERIFAQSLSERTPGVWVFDGMRNSWAGFLAAPDDRNHYFAINPANGRHYQAGGGEYNENSGYINVADGRATPVPQGRLFEGMYFNGPITVDPKTGRLFARVNIPTKEGIPRITSVVLKDDSEAIVPLPPTDLDGLTRDLPDNKALLQFSAGSSGLGSRYIVVGGWESAYDRIRNPVNPASTNPLGQNPAGLAYGDRGVTFAAVPSVDLRSSGASATVAAATADAATQSDRNDAEARAGEHQVPLSFLSGGATCLDGGGQRVDDSAGNGDPNRVHVVCDLAQLRAAGSASFAQDVNGGGQSVGSSSFETRSFRDDKRGVITESTAVAEGVLLRDPSGHGSISIDRVTAHSTSAANGRPGSAKAVWHRTVEGVVITDGEGVPQAPLSCTTNVAAGKRPQRSGDCQALANAVNQVSPSLQVRFPTPAMTATPRGAFARIEEPETDYLNGLTTNNDQSHAAPAMEVMVFNDGPEKGRLLVQLAAIDAYSIFTRSPLFEFPDGTGSPTEEPAPVEDGRDGGAGTGATADVPGGQVSSTAPGATPVGSSTPMPSDTFNGATSGSGVPLAAGGAIPPQAGSPVQQIVGWLLGTRSARDAVTAGGMWLLFVGALAGLWRRRRLIETLGG